jgi:hypothetical protein
MTEKTTPQKEKQAGFVWISKGWSCVAGSAPQPLLLGGVAPYLPVRGVSRATRRAADCFPAFRITQWHNEVLNMAKQHILAR